MFVFLLLLLITFLVFLRVPKTMSKFEIFGCWLITIIYHEDWLTITSINLSLIETNKKLIYALMVVMNRLLLYPMIMILFLELVIKSRSLLAKASLIMALVAVFVSCQHLSDWANLYHHKQWSWWWSVVIWSTEAFLQIGARHVFKKLLKGVERT